MPSPSADDAGRGRLFFFGSFALVPLLPTGFIPPDDLSQTQVYLSLPPGTPFSETLATAERARPSLPAIRM